MPFRPRHVVGALALATLLLAATPAGARSRIESIETENLRLVYPGTTLGFLAPYTVQCFENSIAFHRRVFGWTPSERVTVMLTDNSDYGNAAVVASPRNTMSIQIEPTNFVYETAPSNERIHFIMSHELAHVVTLDQASGADRFFRRAFFGKVRESSDHPETVLYGYLTLPRRAAPRWHREGTAVFFETWMAGGLGRAQGPYDEMVFRSMVRDGAPFYDPLGLESEGTKTDFQIGVNSYLYGGRFTTWVADRFGPQAFLRWVSRRDGSAPYYAAQFRRATGVPLGRAWREWIESERAFQRANLDSVRRYPTTPWQDLSPRALGSVSRACLDTVRNSLYAGVFYPGRVAHLAEIPLDGRPVRAIREVKGPALHFVCSIAWDPEGRRLFYTTDNNDFRDLCVVDPATGRSRRLMRDARVGDLTFNRQDRSLWGVRHFNGASTIVRMPPPYTDYSRVVTLPYGRDVYDLDISPDGTRLALSMAEISGRQSLRLYDLRSLASGDTAGRTLQDFGSSIPTSFSFSPDGRYLYGSSYYTGVSNIFRWDFAADSMDIVTNAETGFFRPLATGGDTLVVFRYSGQGFVPARIVARPLHDVNAITFFGQQVIARHPELETWRIPPPSSVNLDSVVTRRGPYRALQSLRLVSLYPVVEAYKGRTAVGLQARLSDPVGFHDVTATATMTPQQGVDDDERLHATLAWRRIDLTARLRFNPASFYDLLGTTKTSRKGTSLGLEWTRHLIRDEPHTLDLEAGIEGWTGLERLPEAQTVATSPDFDKLLGGSVELRDKNTRSSIGAVDPETGWKWSLGAQLNGVRFERADRAVWRGFPLFYGTGDTGTPLPLRNASLWLRTAAGWSPGDREEPFANFFFGAFGNNGLDYRDPKRYREPGSFPGADIDAVAGTNFGRAMLDANLPPLRFERGGIAPAYASWLRTSIFGSVLRTNWDDRPTRRTLGSAGIQGDLRLMLLSQQPFTLSAGWAWAFERNAGPTREWMVSLKVL